MASPPSFPRVARTPAPAQKLRPLRDFLHTEIAGGIVLVVAALTALVWANSPWKAGYESLWQTDAAVSFGGRVLDLDLRHWLNDGVMAVFFLVVGLEIKRELTHGHLKGWRGAAVPLTAAVGGMAVPALLYLAIAGRSAPRGWGVPMATDIALALGVVALAGSRVPPSMRAFLLGLAIVDDIAAIVVIALFYSSGIEWQWLAVAALTLGATVVARQMNLRAMSLYVPVGVVLWFALHEAGVHPTLAGVAMGLLAPASPRLSPELIDEDELVDVSSVEAARATTTLARNSVSVVEWLQHVLHPWTSYVIVPLFALANAGVPVSRAALDRAIGSAVFWGIAVGLVVGKPVGILLATRAAVRRGAVVPADSDRPILLVGVGTAAGIGFTVAIFIAELAFDDPETVSTAKLAVLIASAISAALSLSILRRARPLP